MKYSLQLAIALCLCLNIAVFAQTEENAYLNIEYLKVESDDHNEFEKLVKEEWKEIYAKEHSPEKLIGWYFYRVVYPGGQGSEYNYTIITTYKDPNTLVQVSDALEKQIQDNQNGLMERTQDIMTRQFSELWKTEAGIYNENDQQVSEFLLMNYMMVNPGKGAEYLTLENDMARPLHEVRIENGEMHSWRTYSLLQPGGSDYKYNFATADHFTEMNHIEFGFTNELIKSVMPGTDINEMFDAIFATREIVKSETWQLVDAL
ncbi:MAG: hypothetical protein U5K71_16210 [Gracilimonas sp.]|nr:hypothetical protein [Gracilimonas sp.]